MRHAGLGSIVKSQESFAAYACVMHSTSTRGFVDGWLRAWNSHDLDAIMEHYANDVIFASPVATQLVPSSNGVIRGKAALRDYWAEGLRKFPDLHFELKETYVGVGIVVINYVNKTGALACEVLEFEGEQVVRGYGTYLFGEDQSGGLSKS